jgi:hypothetical protein
MAASASATGGACSEAVTEGDWAWGVCAEDWLKPEIAAESMTKTAKRNTGYLAF